jgi:hypothetical protein
MTPTSRRALDSPEPLTWTVHTPPGGDRSLSAISEFRGEVLYDGGRRPAYLRPDGRCADPDPSDQDAYHVTASTPSGLVGVMRVIPLLATSRGVCQRLLGSDDLGRLLTIIDADRAETWEGSGWAVSAVHRSNGLGRELLAAGTALAGQLGLRVAIGAAGVRYGQYARIRQAGYRAVPGFDPLPVAKFADEVRMVWGAEEHLVPEFRQLMKRVGGQVKLPGFVTHIGD